MNFRFPLIALALTGCLAEDGDLAASPALVDLSFAASADLLEQRQSTLSGTVELGYADQQMVDITVFDNGVPIHSESMLAKGLELPWGGTVDLLFPETNALTATATYQGQTISTSSTIAVPGALQNLTATPVAGAVDAMEVGVDVNATLGFVSEDDATLTLSVNGAIAASRSLDASTTTVSASETLQLDQLGPNTIDVWLSYEGNVLTDSFVADASAPAPTVTLPTWSNNLDPGVQMRSTGQLDVAPVAPWETTGVRVSGDGGLTWTEASSAGGTLWDVALVNPDIGDQTVLFEVTTAHHGTSDTTVWEDVLHVDPVFNCTSQQSMQPTTELIEDHNTEVRTMVGYFGDPDGGHDISFGIEVSVPQDGLFQVVASTVNPGRFAHQVEFVTDRLRCGGDCTIDYDLAVMVDGQPLCSETNYGVIREY